MIRFRTQVMMIDETKRITPQRALFEEANTPLALDEYQHFTTYTDRNDRSGIDGLGFVLLGLFGETGSLLSELKKKQRDKDAYVAYYDSVIEELGDVLWYFANAALRAGISLSALAQRVTARLANWDYQGQSVPATFADLQKAQRDFRGPLASDLVERQLLALAGKVGLLLEDFSNGRIKSNRDVLSAGLVEIFRALITAADDADVSLEEAACRNIAKTLGRWPVQLDWGQLYDDNYDPGEQLPRQIAIVFTEKEVAGRQYVIQRCNGVNIGDRLTDNRHEADDYRFHDVFHLAYAAILGWSPTLRALFKVKRKSRPEIDENQDGARAILIEEGISTWIFNHGVRNADFRNVSSLDYSILKAVRELVRGYEVESRPLWQWERAILEGFRVFRELRRHRGGTVTADLVNRSINFEPPQ
ncbi:MAG: nucleoside triphosphate pyrophosphohydrolase family protein [Gammaproteobacteria bacterium]